jgi:ketosteroid isomerase-like protein
VNPKPEPSQESLLPPSGTEAGRTVRAFVEAINRRDLDGLIDLMTEDHVFIDSMGTKYCGRERMRDGWRDYFSMVPDYSVSIEESYEEGSVVILLGMSSGTFTTSGDLQAEGRWETPSAWKAVVRGRAVAEWRVYADNEPIRAIMRRKGIIAGGYA